MATFSLEHLVNALSGTVSEDSNVRGQCEQLLTQICSSPGACSLLLNVSTNNQIPIATRLASAIRLKNEVNLKWSSDNEIAEFDKENVRNNLYESIKSCTGDECSNLRAVLLECLRVITCCDFPEKMGSLISVILTDISQRQDPIRMIIALTALRQALSSYEYRPNDSAAGAQGISINSIIEMISNPLISIASEASKSGISNTAAATVIHYVVKIYWSFALISNSTSEKLIELAPNWNQLFIYVLSSDYSQIINHGSGVDERDWETIASRIEGVKCLKWVLRVINLFLSRYTSKTHNDSSNPVKCNLYNHFITSGAVSSTCHSVLSILIQHYGSKIYVPPSILYRAFTFIKRCTQIGSVYKTVIKPHNDKLSLMIFNTLKLTLADEKRLDDNIQEFIECQMNECYNYLTPRQAVSEFITYSTKFRGSDYMPLYVSLLARYLPSMDIPEKFASMSLLGLLADRFTAKKRLNELNVFDTLSKHIMPEITSPSMWLQIKSCWVYSIYVRVANKWAIGQDEALIQVYKLIFEKCISSNFVVKAIAVGCIKEFFSVRSEKVQTIISNTVAQLVPVVFEIMTEMDLEIVAITLNEMIDCYRDQITPHSAEIASHLVRTLKVLLDENDDETGDFSLTALTLLQSLTTLCDSLVGKVDTLSNKCDVEGMIINHIAPLISHIFDNKCFDYYDENIVLLSLMIKLTRQPGVFYSYLDKILESITYQSNDEASDVSFFYIEQMIQSSIMAIKGLFKRDPQTFCNSVHYQQTLLELINKAIEDEDISSAAQLLGHALYATAGAQCGDSFLSKSAQLFGDINITQSNDWSELDNRRLIKLVLFSFYYSCKKYCSLIELCEMGQVKVKSLFEYLSSAKSLTSSERKVVILSLVRILMSQEEAMSSGGLPLLAPSVPLLARILVNVAQTSATVDDSKGHDESGIEYEEESSSEESFFDYQDTHIRAQTGDDRYEHDTDLDDEDEDDEDYYEDSDDEDEEELIPENDEFKALGHYIDSSHWAQALLSQSLGQTEFSELVQSIKTKIN